jgi:hypothetical protein
MFKLFRFRKATSLSIRNISLNISERYYLDSSLIEVVKTAPRFSDFVTKLFKTDNLDDSINIFQ